MKYIFSVERTAWSWKKFGEFANFLGRDEEDVDLNGLCFLNSIEKCVNNDYGLKWSLDNMKDDIMREVTRNAKKYMEFHENVEYKVITSTHAYLESGRFTDSVVDVVILAAAAALKINLYIYCKDGEGILLLPNMCPESTIDVYLQYYHAGGRYHGADHYTALIRRKRLVKKVCSLPSGPSASSFSPAPAVASTSKPSFQSPCTLPKQHSQVTSLVQSPCALPKTYTGVSVPANPLPSSLGVSDITVTLPDGVQVINLPANVQLVEILSLPDDVNLLSGSQNSGKTSYVFSPPLASSTPSFVPASQVISSPHRNIHHASSPQVTNEGSQVTTKKTGKKINVEFRSPTTDSSKSNDDDPSSDEAIVADILNWCEEDVQGFYFIEFGETLHGSSAKTAPVECESQPVVATLEDVMTLEAFAGVNQNASFVPSQEDSDVEAEPDPQTAKSQMLENSQGTNRHSSDEEINNLPEEFNVVARPKRRKWAKIKINHEKCMKMVPEIVDAIPWDVDGDRRFQIFCEEDEYIDKYRDGRWYKMNTTRIKHFNGHRKTGECEGSVLCMNLGCSKLQTEGVVNCVDFRKEFGCYVCKCCGFFAVQKFCGCSKVVEYDKDTKQLTVWYKGKHICTPKPDTKLMRNYFDTLPFKSSLRLTHTELKNNCMRFFLSTGQVDKAMEVAHMLKDPHLIEKMRFLQPGGNISMQRT